MKKAFFALALLLAGLLLILTTSCSPAQAAENQKTVVLRMADPYPEGDPVTINIQNFVDKFNAQARGRYRIELYPGESLIKLTDSLDALRTGAVEMAAWPIGMFSNMDPVFAAAEVPFLANNVEADAAMQVQTMPLYNAVMEKKFNTKALFNFTCLALNLISVKPVKTTADWKGLLTQSVSPQSAKFIEYMGGSSVPLPFPDGYQALQKKVIAASMQSSSMMIQFKMSEVAKYVLRGYLIPASVMVSINLDAYNKMPENIQNLIVNLGIQAQTDTNAFFVNADKENTKTLSEMGVTIYNLPEAERDSWAKTVKPYVDSMFKNMGADFSARLQKIANDANARYPYIE